MTPTHSYTLSLTKVPLSGGAPPYRPLYEVPSLDMYIKKKAGEKWIAGGTVADALKNSCFPVTAQANNGGQECWDFPSDNSNVGRDLPQTMLNIILRKMGGNEFV